MNPPRWDTRNTAMVREELLRRVVEADDQLELSTVPAATSVRSGNRPRLIVAFAIALALIVPASVFALTSKPRSGPAVEQSGTTASQALLLIPAIWRVRDAAGESADTWITFGRSITLIRPKGDVDLSWSTQGDAILTHVEGGSMSLGSTLPKVPWLTSTTRFHHQSNAWILIDASGRQTARLVQDGSPPPSKQSLHDLPTVDAQIRARYTDGVRGATVRPSKPEAVVGDWGLPGVASADGSVSLRADGTWRANTSCEVLGLSDGGGGAYRLLISGSLLVTSGAVGGTGCNPPEHAPSPDAAAILNFYKAGSVALTGAQMTVYDRAGTPLGTLVRKN